MFSNDTLLIVLLMLLVIGFAWLIKWVFELRLEIKNLKKMLEQHQHAESHKSRHE